MEGLSEVLNRFPDRKITIIGDVMLDKDIFGEVSRISPESLAFILKVKEESYNPGGAANVAANISSLGGKASLFGFVADDEPGRILKSILDERKISYNFDSNSKTTLKIRPKFKSPLPVRIDYEDEGSKLFSLATLKIMKEEIANSDLILISDYAKGAITRDLINFVKNSGKRIIIDPKPKNILLYENSFLITPNEKEALEMSGQKDIYSAGRYLRERLSCNVLITRGEKGMSLFSDNEIDIPTSAKEVYDVTGAGDTVIATLALSIASGASLEEAVIIANHAAGIAVSKAGTYQVKIGELERKVSGRGTKIKTFDELNYLVEDLRKKGKRIVWTNGCFDLFHLGHKYYLEKAREKGDVLIVGLDSDKSVRILKGPARPIYSETERAELLSIIESVNYITIFQAGELATYLRKLKPDVYVKSDIYTLDTINQEERKIVEGYGGEIYLPKGLPGFSTTNVINKILNKKTPAGNG
jgi:D-beta-D-heptose 7-phosphate kinase/D-beta-D-heptose 1-phosphate adenosyltransferase